ncbi:unnamed protein product [Phytophthora fragariaefolia]|uniref:Unnamed protein product n=1 Tax=Phytophthora fragariaefolia TaxID=1490495 RepID=A0A9W7CL54_9STRA|nr:unnamed protein product [Phytophthora fragariaefolia]
MRQQRWREVCAKFYYDQDEAAKRVLEHFEACKVDEIRCIVEVVAKVVQWCNGSACCCSCWGSISTVDDSGADAQFNELVELLGLHKCMVPGHEDKLNQTCVGWACSRKVQVWALMLCAYGI